MAWFSARRLAYTLVGLSGVVFAVGALPDQLAVPVWVRPLFSACDHLYANFSGQLLSVAVLVGVLDLLHQRRLGQQRRQGLLDQLSSHVPGLAAEAVRLLRRYGWYDDADVLRGLQEGGDFYRADLRKLRVPEHVSGLRAVDGQIDLTGARLEGADLAWAWLDGAFLGEAQLAGAKLRSARLEKTILWGASLSRADLQEARLMDADLKRAQLTEASLRRAHLKRADLHGAHLQGARVREAQFDEAVLTAAHLEGTRGLTVGQLEAAESLEGCVLPDGTRLPGREGDYGEPEPDWRGAFAMWMARGIEQGWIYCDPRMGHGFIDVDKIPLRDGEAVEV
jgi:uncharacterized protein YjbI with pentapeptide repeats